jgi:hypothetical protein
MKSRTQIMERVREHYHQVELLGYDIVGIFLQGSQNYNLDDEFSDIDTKAIVLPSFEDLVSNKMPVSTTYIMENNEHIDIKDIRVMFKTILKQNINFVEILFTEYKLINPEYFSLFAPIYDIKERVSRYNDHAALNCMLGMAYEKQKALKHPYPGTIDKIEKFGYDPKQLHHIIRMFEFMVNYTNGEDYKTCLINNSGYQLKCVKRGCYSLEDAERLAFNFPEEMKNLRDFYVSNHIIYVDKEVEEIMNTIVASILRKSLYNDICKGEK